MTDAASNPEPAPAAPAADLPLAAVLVRWAGKAAEALSAALSVKLAPGKVELVTSDGDSLQEIFLEAGAWIRADISAASATGPAFIFAPAAAAKLAIALQAKKDDVAELDQSALAAFGEFAKTVFMALAPSIEPAPSTPPEFTLAAPGTQAPQEALRGWKGKLASFPLAAEGKGEIGLKLFLGESVCGVLAPCAESPKGVPAVTQSVGGVNRILGISVPVIVEIARRRITLKEVVAFKPGTVVEFEKKSDDLLDLASGTARIGKGEAVKIGESFGLRVLEVGSVSDRIKSLGGSVTYHL